MKFVLLLADGMADWPIPSLDNKTPMMVAKKTNMNNLAYQGKIGLCQTVPEGFAPGSDVANLSALGYPPQEFYTGRSSLEALSIGVAMTEGDISLRANIVTLSMETDYQDKTMVDYSSGEIASEEAKILIDYLKEELDDEIHSLFAGISYRNILLWHEGPLETELTPPHDITGQAIKDHLPKGPGSDYVINYQIKAHELLSAHPLNKEREKQGLPPANAVWFWGLGTAPLLPSFKDRYGLKASVICAVDLIKGIGIGAAMNVPDVPGATGNFHTNYLGKAEAALKELQNGSDFCFIHVEAPDESGHQGKLDEKIKSIEIIDDQVLKTVINGLKNMDEDYRILVMPDHATPMEIRTHSRNPVPFLIFDSRHHQMGETAGRFDEETAEKSGLYFQSGEALLKAFLNKDFY